MTPAAALTVECPQCHEPAGSPCLNYKGKRCAPHGQRTAAAKIQPEPATEPAPPIVNGAVPEEAVGEAQAIARRWGTTALVRACVAVLNTHTSYRDSMDLSEAPRVIAIQQRARA